MLQELKEGKNQWVRVLRKKEKFDPDFNMDFDRGSRGIPGAEMSKNSGRGLNISWWYSEEMFHFKWNFITGMKLFEVCFLFSFILFGSKPI